MTDEIRPVRLRLSNGWTVSIGSDLKPALASVAAWPTADDNKSAQFVRWHDFGGGRLEVRVFDVGDIIEAFRSISALETVCDD